MLGDIDRLRRDCTVAHQRLACQVTTAESLLGAARQFDHVDESLSLLVRDLHRRGACASIRDPGYSTRRFGEIERTDSLAEGGLCTLMRSTTALQRGVEHWQRLWYNQLHLERGQPWLAPNTTDVQPTRMRVQQSWLDSTNNFRQRAALAWEAQAQLDGERRTYEYNLRRSRSRSRSEATLPQ